MNAQVPRRGSDLLAGGRTFGFLPRWLLRAWTGGVHKIIDRVDAGLVRGSIEATLPDGTTRLLGGREPGFTVQVDLKSWRALFRLATGGSVGWYQAWEAEEWDSPDPVSLFALFMDNSGPLGDTARARGPWRMTGRLVNWLRRNTRSGALRNIHVHYDLGNDFYATWLGSTMVYSSGMTAVKKRAPDKASQFYSLLDGIQIAKIEATARRLALRPGARVLEIGCGWGTMAGYLAQAKRAKVDAISLSDEQLDYARERYADAGVTFLKQDYRDVSGQYDAIVSIEMVEAVGRQYWPAFLDCVAGNLKPGGRAAIQYIAIRDDLFDAYAASADFIQTYIFPGGMLIRESEFRELAEACGLAWTDRRAFGKDYAETLKMWRGNFDNAVEVGRLPAGFDHHFVRLWRYYLMYCEGGFRGGGIDVHQVTLVKEGRE